MKIRNSVKAIIIKEENLLTIKKVSGDQEFYILPGGGQEHGETLEIALKRECVEEVNTDVEVGNLIFMREYIGKNHEFSEKHRHVHQIEFMFHCKINEWANVKIGVNPDQDQVGVEWLPIKELYKFDLYPKEIRSRIIGFFQGIENNVYLGDIN
ncbi:NUDIX domain-containing protein [Falsibacillus albus]|uniref:NUDIX domain-containing protein n=1 Tax=Falsibacillus albus TaxID=2478915 RepID=A0A3L7JX66_9BACI|nr:NUDIX domain-containing protein [Falsibacillus albus]RLQ94251.1 NUDIX domain-containing protein [Falsibacillus albus]